MPNFTTEDLLMYLYGDMQAEQKTELEAALITDWVLQQKYSVLSEAKHQLDESRLHSPRPSTVLNILSYAEMSLHPH